MHPGVVGRRRRARGRGHERGSPRLYGGDAAPLPAPALRRPAAAHRPGHGLRLPALTHRARRADDRPGRHDPAPRTGHRPQALPLLRRGGRLREPRPGRRQRAGERRRRHVRGPHHRARADVPAVRRAAASLYPRPDRRGAVARARRGAHRHRRPAAAAGPPRRRLLVRRPLRLRHRQLPSLAPEPPCCDGRTVRCLRATEIRATPAERPAALPGRVRQPRPRPILSVRGVSASYGDTPVLSGIRLDVAPRSLRRRRRRVGLGQDHARPLHCRAAQQLDRRDHLPGRRPGPRRPPSAQKEVLRRVQYIFQNPYTSLNPRKTVGQIVAQPLEQFLDLPFRERVRARRPGARGCLARRATSCPATRTSYPAGSGSASRSPGPWWPSRTC